MKENGKAKFKSDEIIHIDKTKQILDVKDHVVKSQRPPSKTWNNSDFLQIII